MTGITDINGIFSPITVGSFKGLMQRYAIYYKLLWGNLNIKINTVMISTTEAEVAAVTW
jgi:hypothetical protein